ncbi:MAG: shikimate dehydrogenase family protein [Breznakia sp.]
MKYGLIGEHLKHSYSKIIQERLLDNYHYDLKELTKSELGTFMKHKDFLGINVTIPYKQAVLPYLDEVDDSAKKIGAINTIVHKNHRLFGYNSDYYGFAYMLDHHHIDICDKKIIILGNGGASRAVQAVIKDRKPRTMLVVSRHTNDATIFIDEVYKQHLDADIIINTTPVGMYPKIHASCIDLTNFDKLSACIDVIYNPYATTFLLAAKAKNILAIGGLEMLVAQAKKTLEIFKDISIDEREIDIVYKELTLTTINIILVDVNHKEAKQVAVNLHKTFIDNINISSATHLRNALICVSSKKLQHAKLTTTLVRNSWFLNEKTSNEIIAEFQSLLKYL